MALTLNASDTQEHFQVMAGGRFYPNEDIALRTSEKFLSPGSTQEDDVAWIVSQVYDVPQEKLLAEAQWPSPIECERLEQTFNTFRQEPLIALRHSGNNNSDRKSGTRLF